MITRGIYSSSVSTRFPVRLTWKTKHFRDSAGIYTQDSVSRALRASLQNLKRPPAGRKLIAKTVGDPTITFCSGPKALKRFTFHCSRTGKKSKDKEEQTGNCFLWCFSSHRNSKDMKSKIQLYIFSMWQPQHNKLSREHKNKNSEVNIKNAMNEIQPLSFCFIDILFHNFVYKYVHICNACYLI